MALFDELNRLESIDTKVALDVELEQEALQSHYVKGAVICDQDEILLIFMVLRIQLETLTNQVLKSQ